MEPASGSPPAKPVVVEFRTFDGLVVRGAKARSAATRLGRLHGQRRRGAGGSRGGSRDAARGGTATSKEGDTAGADEPKPATPATPPPDPAAEAARINAKVGPWRYKIATFQYDQMTRRMADLLKPPTTK